MQRLEVSYAVRPIYGSFGAKGMIENTVSFVNIYQYFQGQAAVLKYGIWDIFVKQAVR